MLVSADTAGVSASIHRLHSKLEDLSNAASWRDFDGLSSEKKALLLSFMDPSDREQVVELSSQSGRKGNAPAGGFGVVGVSGDPSMHPPPALASVDGAPTPTASRPPRPSTAGTRAGGDVKDIWKARVNLRLARERHERHQVVVAEEMKWKYDRRIIVKGEVVEGSCTRVTLGGLGETQADAIRSPAADNAAARHAYSF